MYQSGGATPASGAGGSGNNNNNDVTYYDAEPVPTDPDYIDLNNGAAPLNPEQAYADPSGYVEASVYVSPNAV
jgi:hypothetical protein